jgi:hypothetical protein
MLPAELRDCEANKEWRGLVARGATLSLRAHKNHGCMGTLGAPRRFTFDAVMSESKTTDEVFASTGARAVQEAVRGVNAVVFAFGQSGSGKTYTLLGEFEDSDSSHGSSIRAHETDLASKTGHAGVGMQADDQDGSSHTGNVRTHGQDHCNHAGVGMQADDQDGSSRAGNVATQGQNHYSHAGTVCMDVEDDHAAPTHVKETARAHSSGQDTNMDPDDIPGRTDTYKRRGIAIMTYGMLRDALRTRAEKECNVSYVIQCCALQVYLGHVYDLLAPDPTQPLLLRANTVSKTLAGLGGEVREMYVYMHACMYVCMYATVAVASAYCVKNAGRLGW